LYNKKDIEMLKYIALIIFSATTSLAADSSVFDVLQSQDQERYTTSDTKEFDVNEGEENNVDISTIQNVQIDQRAYHPKF
jgi:predicted nucleotidyltransferase